LFFVAIGNKVIHIIWGNFSQRCGKFL